MIINLTHPEKIAYRMKIDPGLSPLEHISPSYRNKISASLKKFGNSSYRIQDEALTGDLLNKFLKLYESFMATKPGQVPLDVESTVKAHSANGRKYRILCLYNHEVLVGAEIYSVRDTFLSLAYKVLPHRSEITMKANLSMMMDYEFLRLAHQQGLDEVRVGRDSNVYGQKLSIGLLNYKLGFGYNIRVANNPVVINKLSFEEGKDYAVICCDPEGKSISSVNIILDSPLAEFKIRYPMLFSYQQLPIVLRNSAGEPLSL